MIFMSQHNQTKTSSLTARLCGLALVLSAFTGMASAASAPDASAVVSAADSLARLKAGNARFVAERAENPHRSVTRRGESSASADVDFVDARGELVARIEGSEHTVDASLKAAFGKSVGA